MIPSTSLGQKYFQIITSKSQLSLLTSDLKGRDEYIAYDLETTGLNPRKDKIIGIALAYGDLSHVRCYYLATRVWDKVRQELVNTEILEDMPQFLIDYVKPSKLITHNGVFDVNFTYHDFEVELAQSVYSDTQMQRHTIDPTCSTRFALKELSNKYWPGASQEQADLADSVVANGGMWKGKQKEFYKANLKILKHYACQDVFLTLNLFHLQNKQLEEMQLTDLFYKDEVMPLYRECTIPMNRYGLKIDMDKLARISHDMQNTINNITKEIYDELGDIYPPFEKKKKLNINSNMHVAWLLFAHFKEFPEALTDAGVELAKRISGKRPYNKSDMLQFLLRAREQGHNIYKLVCVDADNITEYAPKYKWIDNLLKLKKEEKLYSSYVESIGEMAENGYIYPQFLQFGTVTGRYSSSKPNCQNIPRKDDRIKSFMMADEGKLFIAADQSQLEPRVLAHLTKDPLMIAAFQNGLDFYSVIGIQAMGLDTTKFSADPKLPNFLKNTKEGVMYRDTAKVIALATAYNTSSFQMKRSLKKMAGLIRSIAETQEIITNYLDSFPSIRNYMDKMKSVAMNNGVCYNMFGRIRQMPVAQRLAVLGKTEDNDYNLKRELNVACNYPIQSTASSIMNRCMIAVAKEIQSHPEWGARIVLQVHDALYLEANEEYAKEVANMLQDKMENTIKLRLPLEAVPSIGKYLKDCK
jgi:DNA polymerase-1